MFVRMQHPVLRGILVMLGTGALAVVWSGVHPLVAAPRDGEVINPHWKPNACGTCHANTGNPQSIGIAEAERRCLECHDGVHARREVHPVGRAFDGKRVILPDGWPTLEGKLACLTCHDVLLGCHPEARPPKNNSVFLREYRSDRPLKFCAKCHVSAAKSGGRYSPHVTMLDEQGSIREEACLFCHERSFHFDGRRTRTGDAQLRADQLTLCASCHRKHKDWFSPGHIGHVATKQVLRNMLKTDADAGFASGPADRPGERRPQCLPLSSGRRIVCGTCHNPHQQGVFDADSILARGAMAPANKDKSHRLALRGFGKDVCYVCHRK